VSSPSGRGVALGAVAPDFELRDQHAQSHRLSDYRGSKNVVVVFYPFAFTGVCSGELADIQAEIGALQNDQTQVLAISCDPLASLRVFADREGFDFPLLSDFWPHGATASAYAVFNEVLGAAERATFVIDKHGVVRWTVRVAITEARDVAAYQKALAEL
jgi:mycoredoxin-dependent peroxiredoxin